MKSQSSWTKFIHQQDASVVDRDILLSYIQVHCSLMNKNIKNIQECAESMFFDVLKIEQSSAFQIAVQELLRHFSSSVVDGVLYELISATTEMDTIKRLINLIPQSTVNSKEKMALRACVYMGYHKILGDVNALYVHSDISFGVFKIFIVAEDKEAEKWLFNEFPLFWSQREDSFYIQLFQFVLFNPTKEGMTYLQRFKSKVVEAIDHHYRDKKTLSFPFAHRWYTIHKEASNNDLALLLTIIPETCLNFAIECFQKTLNFTSHFKQMVFNESFDEAKLCVNYIKNDEIDDLLQVLPAEVVDKMKYTDTLYPRFLNRVLYKAIEPIIETTTTKSVRRL